MDNQKNEQSTSSNGDFEIDVVQTFLYLWKNRKAILKIAGIGCLLGLIVAFSIPKKYTATVKLALETSSGSGSNGLSQLAGIAGITMGNGSGGISPKTYPQIISSMPYMLEFMKMKVTTLKDSSQMSLYEYVMYHQRKPWWGYVMSFPMKIPSYIKQIFSDREENRDIPTNDYFHLSGRQKGFAAQLSSMVNFSIESKNNFVNVDVIMQDPLVAAIVVDSVVVNLQKYMDLYTTKKAVENLKQIQKSYQEARSKYYQSQVAYASYLDGHYNVISESSRVAQARLENEMNLAYNVYNLLAQQLETSKIKVQECRSIFTIIEPAYVPLKESAPNKMLIIIAMTFLGGVVGCAFYLWKYLFKEAEIES